MAIIPDILITKDRGKTESYYHFLIARYISPFFTMTFHKVRIISPVLVTLASFITIILSSMLVLNIELLNNISHRIFIALMIQLSFILDASDGQLARISGRTSKLGAWLDKLLDRVGEFAIFTIFGITAWRQTSTVIFIFLGICTGYCLSAFTLAMSLSDSSLLENIKSVIKFKRREDKSTINNKKSIKDTKFAFIITRVFFFLNFGIGERYLYLSFFIIINRIDIMLYISAFLTTLRFLSISYYVGQKLKKIDGYMRESNANNL